MTFDTASPVTWAYGAQQCTGAGNHCPLDVNKLNTAASTTAKVLDGQNIVKVHIDEKGSVQGYRYADDFCFNYEIADSCIPGAFKFLNVFRSTNLNTLQSSGVVGLAPISNITNLPSLMSQMDSARTDKIFPAFSIFYSDNYFYNGAILFG